jgi:hypothetical protein
MNSFILTFRDLLAFIIFIVRFFLVLFRGLGLFFGFGLVLLWIRRGWNEGGFGFGLGFRLFGFFRCFVVFM